MKSESENVRVVSLLNLTSVLYLNSRSKVLICETEAKDGGHQVFFKRKKPITVTCIVN